MKKSLIVVALIVAMTGCEERTCPPVPIDYSLAGCVEGETYLEADGYVFDKELSEYGELMMSIVKMSDTTVIIAINNRGGSLKFSLRTDEVRVFGESFDVYLDGTVSLEKCILDGKDYEELQVRVSGTNTPEYECDIEVREVSGNAFWIDISGMTSL